MLIITVLTPLQQRVYIASRRAAIDSHFPAGSTICWHLGLYPATAPHPVLRINLSTDWTGRVLAITTN